MHLGAADVRYKCRVLIRSSKLFFASYLCPRTTNFPRSLQALLHFHSPFSSFSYESTGIFTISIYSVVSSRLLLVTLHNRPEFLKHLAHSISRTMLSRLTILLLPLAFLLFTLTTSTPTAVPASSTTTPSSTSNHNNNDASCATPCLKAYKSDDCSTKWLKW